MFTIDKGKQIFENNNWLWGLAVLTNVRYGDNLNKNAECRISEYDCCLSIHFFLNALFY